MSDFHARGRVLLSVQAIAHTIALRLPDEPPHARHCFSTPHRVDVGDVGIDEDTHEVLYATSTYLRRTFTFYDKGVEEDFVLLETKFPDQEPRLVNETSDKSKWVVSLTSDVKSTEYYILDRKTKALTFLFASQPKVPSVCLCASFFRKPLLGARAQRRRYRAPNHNRSVGGSAYAAGHYHARSCGSGYSS